MEDILILTQQKTDSPNFIRFVYAMSNSAKVVDQGQGGPWPLWPPLDPLLTPLKVLHLYPYYPCCQWCHLTSLQKWQLEKVAWSSYTKFMHVIKIEFPNAANELTEVAEMALDFFAEFRQFNTNKKICWIQQENSCWKFSQKSCPFCLIMSFLTEKWQIICVLGFLTKCLNSFWIPFFGNIVWIQVKFQNSEFVTDNFGQIVWMWFVN